MSVLDEIRTRLMKYPGLDVVDEPRNISVSPPDGFTVWISDNEGSWTVGFDGWHEEFENSSDAMNCFAWGLSNESRLKISSKGDKAYKWVAQSLEDGKWVNDTTTGLLLFPFWKKTKISYKQNAIIDS